MAWLSRLRVAVPMNRSTIRSSSRSLGSAAAVALDYDYYDDEYYGGSRLDEPRLGMAGFEPEKGVNWVLMGEPSTRRHVYAERLSNLLEVPHISMGTLVRQELNPKSSLYKKIAISVNERKPVPETVIFALLSKRLEEGYYRGENGFILDGIPRTRVQAEILDQIADIDLVVNLKCSEEHLIRRLAMSKTARSQESLGSGLSSAVSNNDLKEHCRAYTEQVKPLEEYYRKQRKLLNFKVGNAPGETWYGLLAALHLPHKHTVDTPQKLSV